MEKVLFGSGLLSKAKETSQVGAPSFLTNFLFAPMGLPNLNPPKLEVSLPKEKILVVKQK